MKTLPPIWLDHINIPAHDPELLAQWYADRLNLERRGAMVVGPGISIFFSKGAPLAAGEKFHFGLRAETKHDVAAWADALGMPIAFDEDDFFATRITDPDGNLFEIYWDKL